jgi:hypothetical protein
VAEPHAIPPARRRPNFAVTDCTIYGLRDSPICCDRGGSIGPNIDKAKAESPAVIAGAQQTAVVLHARPGTRGVRVFCFDWQVPGRLCSSGALGSGSGWLGVLFFCRVCDACRFFRNIENLRGTWVRPDARLRRRFRGAGLTRRGVHGWAVELYSLSQQTSALLAGSTARAGIHINRAGGDRPIHL